MVHDALFSWIFDIENSRDFAPGGQVCKPLLVAIGLPPLSLVNAPEELSAFWEIGCK
jgi:hypothetical protein